MIPVLLLPGMMCDARLFHSQIMTLSTHWPVMVLPISGSADMAELATQVLDAAPERFALAGLSMGGILAMEVLRQAPHRVERIALLDTNPLAEAESMKAKRAIQIAAAQSGELEKVLHDELIPNYLAQGKVRKDIRDVCLAMGMDLGPEVFARQSVALRDRHDQQETLSSYKGRALVLCGEQDALCPIERHELMHELLSNSRLQIIEGAGHLPTLEQPHSTTAALMRWLEN